MSASSRDLLAAARAARPSTQARARIDAGLALQIVVPSILSAAAVPPVPPPLPAPALAAPALGGGGGLAAKIVLVAALSGGAGTTGAALWTAHASRPVVTAPAATTHAARAPARPVVSSVAPSPPKLPDPAPSSSPDDPPVPTPPRPGASPPPRAVPSAVTVAGTMGETPRPPAPPAASSAGSFPEELAALRDAQRALKRGDGAQALAQLDALAERHPDGVLQEERLAARVLGLCAAGRSAEAREAGRRFVAEHPGSVQIDRVRASCAFSPRDEER